MLEGKNLNQKNVYLVLCELMDDNCTELQQYNFVGW